MFTNLCHSFRYRNILKQTLVIKCEISNTHNTIRYHNTISVFQMSIEHIIKNDESFIIRQSSTTSEHMRADTYGIIRQSNASKRCTILKRARTNIYDAIRYYNTLNRFTTLKRKPVNIGYTIGNYHITVVSAIIIKNSMQNNKTIIIRKANTSLKCITPNGNTIRNNNLYNRITSPKCVISDICNTVWYCHICKRTATLECGVLNQCYAIW